MSFSDDQTDKRDVGILAPAVDFAGVYGLAFDLDAFMHQVDDACEKAVKTIKNGSKRVRNTPVPQAKGNYAEYHHAATFNVDAALKRMNNVKAHVLESNKDKSPDVVITKNKNKIREYGLKYYKTAKRSVNKQKGYSGQKRLIPDEQISDGREYIRRQIAKDRATGRSNRLENADKLERVEENLTGRIQEKGVQSKPLSREDAEEKLKNIRNGESPDVVSITCKEIASESLRSGAIAFGITLGMGIAPQIYKELRHWQQEGEFDEGALQRVFEDSTKLATEAGIRGALSTSLTMAAKAGYFGVAAKNVSPHLVGTLVYLTVEGVKDFWDYRNGKLSGEWFADGMMQKSAGAAGGVYGAAYGQIAFPIPIVGAMIGATLGSVLANTGYKLIDLPVDAFYREEQLEELAITYSELATVWVDIEQRYEHWAEHDPYYRERVNEYKQKQAEHNQKRGNLNQQLRDALDENE